MFAVCSDEIARMSPNSRSVPIAADVAARHPTGRSTRAGGCQRGSESILVGCNGARTLVARRRAALAYGFAVVQDKAARALYCFAFLRASTCRRNSLKVRTATSADT